MTSIPLHSTAVRCSECDYVHIFAGYSMEMVGGCTYDCPGCGVELYIHENLSTTPMRQMLAEEMSAVLGREIKPEDIWVLEIREPEGPEAVDGG